MKIKQSHILPQVSTYRFSIVTLRGHNRYHANTYINDFVILKVVVELL